MSFNNKWEPCHETNAGQDNHFLLLHSTDAHNFSGRVVSQLSVNHALAGVTGCCHISHDT